MISRPLDARSPLRGFTLIFSSGAGLAFTRTTPVAPFDADLSLALNVIDADGVAYAANPARFGQALAGLGIAFSGAKQMRFARLRLANALGSEKLPLAIPIQVQHWNGSGFVTNTLDGCTTLARANFALGAYTGNLNACETIVTSATVTFASGVGTLSLSAPCTGAPCAGNDGNVLLTLNLSSPPSGNQCAAMGAAGPAATSANLSFLLGRWDAIDQGGDGTFSDDNPTSRGVRPVRCAGAK